MAKLFDLFASESSTVPERKGEAGFSILETAVALVLMSIVGLGAASLFYFSVNNTVTVSDREMSMAVAQQKMEQLRNLDFLDANLAASGPASSTLSRAGRPYTVTTTIVDSDVINGLATKKTITIKVSPTSDPARWARNISSFFGSVTLVGQRTALSVGPNRAL